MKKTKSAVKYGMETLKVSPDELFKLIESSQGYDGEDYSRWLVSKIIDVAEDDGVQFSQLLVKKFNIINEILEEVSESQEICDSFINIFKRFLYPDVYSIGIGGIGETVDIDWYNGLDLDNENSFFVKEKLPLEIKKKILEKEKISLLFRLSLDGVDKKSDLYTDAKGQGLTLSSKGAMILYRLCSIASHFDVSNMKIGVLVPVKFLYDKDNEGIINYLLSFYKISVGYSIKSIEMSINSLNAGDMAFIVFEARSEEDEVQDGIVLSSITLDNEELLGYKVLDRKRYSRSNTRMLDYIIANQEKMVDVVDVQRLGEIVGKGEGLSSAYGYLSVGSRLVLNSLPEEGCLNIPITDNNIKDIIAFYGVTVSKEIDWGYSSEVSCLVDGRSGYDELLNNCLPLFLFDINSRFRVIGDNENKLDIFNSKIIQDLLDVGIPYFSFEAKELFNTCKEYIEFNMKNFNIEGKTFQELREDSNSNDLNSLYESKLNNLKDFINTLSKNFL